MLDGVEGSREDHVLLLRISLLLGLLPGSNSPSGERTLHLGSSFGNGGRVEALPLLDTYDGIAGVAGGGLEAGNGVVSGLHAED